MSEWKKVKLGEITIIKTGKLDSNAAVPNGAYPFFTCDPTTLSIDKWAYDTEAILLAGNNASGNYTAKYYKGKFNAYQRTYIIETLNPQFASVRYMAYAMNQQLQLLKVVSSGSTTKFLTMKMLTQLSIDLPSIETQHRIATILSRYDSLIENYQKQIKLLEEAAQRLYKEWFIDLHFPGHENTKIVDGLPEGWEMKKVGEIAIISAGGDKPDVVTEEQTTECQVPIYSNGTTKEGLYGYTNKSSNTAGCITVSARGSIGFACLRMHDYFSIVRLISIKPQNHVDLMYLFQFTKVHTFMSNGAAQQQLTVPMVKAIDVVYPAESLLEAFDNVVLPLYKKVQSLQSQLRLLTEARDRLLPKLMGGEITV